MQRVWITKRGVGGVAQVSMRQNTENKKLAENADKKDVAGAAW